MRVADAAGELASAGIAAFTTGLRATSTWRVIAPITRLSPSREMPESSGTFFEVDEGGGRGEALLHRREERHAAGERLGVRLFEVGERARERVRAMIFKGVHREISE